MSTLCAISNSSCTLEAWTKHNPEGAQMPEPPQKSTPLTPWLPTALHATIQIWCFAAVAAIIKPLVGVCLSSFFRFMEVACALYKTANQIQRTNSTLTMLLLGSGLAGLGFFRRRRKAAWSARILEIRIAAVYTRPPFLCPIARRMQFISSLIAFQPFNTEQTQAQSGSEPE